MIVVRLQMCSSFQRRIAYPYRGKPEHVLAAWTQLVTLPARMAATEMRATADNQSRMKEAAGIRRGGRRCEKPVSHDVISWDEDERPDLAELERAARSFLAAIGLGEHQAVMVGHDHNGKRHVHIVANAVHPITGKVADRTNDHFKAQAWAHAYEVAQGTVRCRHRTAPRMDRAFALAATGNRKSGQRLSREEYNWRRKRKQADAEAKARHKAAKWAALIAQVQVTAANADRTPDKQKADKLPAPRP